MLCSGEPIENKLWKLALVARRRPTALTGLILIRDSVNPGDQDVPCNPLTSLSRELMKSSRIFGR